MGFELWPFTLWSLSWSLRQRTTRSRCGTCKRPLLPKSKNDVIPVQPDSYCWFHFFSAKRKEINSFKFTVVLISVRETNTQTAVCLVQPLAVSPQQSERHQRDQRVVDDSLCCCSVSRFSCRKLSPCDKELTHYVKSQLCSPHTLVRSDVMDFIFQRLMSFQSRGYSYNKTT